MSFLDPEEEKKFKAQLIRYPAYIEFLQNDLKHCKDDILTCKSCPHLQNPTLTSTIEALALASDDGGELQVRLPPATPSMSNLLSELLLEIFFLLVSEDPPAIRETWDTSETEILATPYLGWIRITHVCRRWHYLAIGTAALWTNFSHGLILGSSWTEEFINRVKAANTSIPPFDSYPRSIDAVCDYIMDHSPHLRDITLSAEWTSMQLIWGFCDFYLPMTVSANLDAGLKNWHNANLFGGYAPNLRHLRLYNIIPWTAHSFLENLIELHVFLCDDQVTTVKGEVEPIALILFPPLAQVLDVLDEASRLEHLSLHYAIPPEDLTADEARKVHFSYLKSFSMASKVQDCVSFLKRIDIPHDATLDLTCIPGLSLDKFQDLFRALAFGIYNAGDHCPSIERLELGAVRFDDRALIRAYGGHAETGRHSNDSLARKHHLDLSHLSQRPMITLSLAYASPQDYKVVLQDFFPLMPLQGLIYLSIYGCSTIRPEDWRSIIRDSSVHCQSVRFLVLGHDCAQYFFHAIHDKDDFLSGFGPTAFSNLDRLIFRRVDFSMFPRSDVSEASFQDQMLYHIRERMRRGKPLRAVFFFSCQGIEEEWLRDLEEVVKFVRLGL